MNNLRKDDYCRICKEPLKDYPNNGEPRLGIVFGATTIAVDDTKENRKALRLPCQKD